MIRAFAREIERRAAIGEIGLARARLRGDEELRVDERAQRGARRGREDGIDRAPERARERQVARPERRERAERGGRTRGKARQARRERPRAVGDPLLRAPERFGEGPERAHALGAPPLVAKTNDGPVSEMNHHRRFDPLGRNHDAESGVEHVVRAAPAESADERRTNVEPVPAALIERSAATDDVVPLGHEHPASGSRQGQGRGQTGNSRPDDDRIVLV